MIRVAIHGAAGRMGCNLLSACLDDPGVELAAAIEHADHDRLGVDAGQLIGRPETGILLTHELPPAIEVVVDFSRPDATIALLEECRERGIAVVIGTTGFDPTQRAIVGEAATAIPVVLAPNMGVGINLIFGLVEAASRVLGDDFDAEVIEAHHRHKVDAPSGTALRLGELVAFGRGRSLADCAILSREGHTGERLRGAIGFATVRGGDTVGEHTVMFGGEGERVEITHRATSRQVFAHGAMRAITWIHDRPAGLYDMQDVLDLGLS